MNSAVHTLGAIRIAHLKFTADAHRYGAYSLHRLAHNHCNGRMIALGGGGYNSTNIAEAWTSVVKSFVKRS